MRFIALVALTLLVVSCKHEAGSDLKEPDAALINKMHPAKFEFEKTVHEFGKIAVFEEMVYDFEFTNVGESPLIIVDVNTSCGCTATDWPTEPIEPGGGGKITVTFSTGTVGKTRKAITISANTYPETNTQLLIEGEVVE